MLVLITLVWAEHIYRLSYNCPYYCVLPKLYTGTVQGTRVGVPVPDHIGRAFFVVSGSVFSAAFIQLRSCSF